MSYEEFILTLRKAAIAAFHHEDGTLNKYKLLKASGLTKQQLDIVFDVEKNPTFKSICKLAEAVGLKIELNGR